MRNFGRLLMLMIWLIALMAAILMLFSAFSPSLVNPVSFPLLSLAGFVFPVLTVINLLFFIFFLLCRQFKLSLLPLLCLIACYGQIHTYFPLNPRVNERPEGSLKIVSYNTMGFGSKQKKEGKNEILDYLAASDADIICLQEHSVSGSKKFVTQKDVDNALSAYKYRATKAKGKQPKSSITIYSKLPVLKTEKIPMESNSNGATAYLLKWGQDTLQVVNCHLESNRLTDEDKEIYEHMIDQPEKEQVKEGIKVLLRKLAKASAIRAPQADSIVSYLKKHPYRYTIVCGDFNDTPISYTHHKLTEPLNDAFTLSGRGLGISYNRNRFLFRIDNIFVSEGLLPKNCAVDTSINASDHYPIWSYVEKN
ncbi:MAG: endonuclease/exonuclease/phosphatase family protein [Bacteroidaceae bacterium]|nr:endonuclease/exonuclease/phosphatase family protein [Bacteroidaceae bacterium]